MSLSEPQSLTITLVLLELSWYIQAASYVSSPDNGMEEIQPFIFAISDFISLSIFYLEKK